MERNKLARQAGYLSHETRLHIIELLIRHGPMQTRELFDSIGDTDPKNWYHLQALCRSGMVYSTMFDAPLKLWHVDEKLVQKVIDELHEMCYNEGATKGGSTSC
jgi:predicted transcriptional regulator